MSGFNGKAAVVTGGNSRMGLATAKELAANGAKVVIAGRDRKTLDAAVKAIGNESFGVKTDVLNLADIENLFNEANAKFGKIDILFVNAGIGKFAALEQSDEAFFDEIVDINFKGSLKDIEAIGAKAAIGTMEDAEFLATTFRGADVVYAMESLAPNAFFDPNVDVIAVHNKIGNNYKQAIEQSGIKRVVHLSGVGAHTDKGNGLIAFHYNVENILNQLPADVSIKFMRPVGFYTTMFPFIQTIKTQGAIVSNYGGDEKEPWVSPLDIATVISEEIEKPFDGRTIRYIASDEVSPNEAAKILGEAIGKPELKWLIIPDEQFLQGLLAAGMNPQTARGFVEINESKFGGVMYEDYNRHKPTLGKVKLKDFAEEFAAVYNQQ